jgi:hypothetical protein
VRPDAYLIVAAGRWLYAPTLAELAEVAECALDAGDRIELLRLQHSGGWRSLPECEFERFLDLLAARLA